MLLLTPSFLPLYTTRATMPELRIRHKKKRDPRRSTLTGSDETANQIQSARELMQQDPSREVSKIASLRALHAHKLWFQGWHIGLHAHVTMIVLYKVHCTVSFVPPSLETH